MKYSKPYQYLEQNVGISHNSLCSLSVSLSSTEDLAVPNGLTEHVCAVASPAGFLCSPINVTNP